jgi:hypothetical protein
MGEARCIIPPPYPYPFPGKWIWWLNGFVAGIAVTIAALNLYGTRNDDSGPIFRDR